MLSHDVACEKSDDIFEVWKHNLHRFDVLEAIGSFVQKHRGAPQPSCNLPKPTRDSSCLENPLKITSYSLTKRKNKGHLSFC